MEQKNEVVSLLTPLSERERLVAGKSAEGLTYREIAEELFIAPNTVRTHLSAIYKKLGIRNKAALINLLGNGNGTGNGTYTSDAPPTALLQSPPACPYPGIVSFQAEDAAHFYGREKEIQCMLQHLRQQRLLMVIGPSGSGKSSLIHAGLLPKLGRSRYFNTGYWLVRQMRPGHKPSHLLDELLSRKKEPKARAYEVVQHLLECHAPAQRLLLLVDKFEEVFTQTGRDERYRFINALQTLRGLDNCALLLVMRADFYHDLMASELWPVDASQRLEIAPLRGDALRAAIEKPAAAVGVHLEEGLVGRLLADAANEPGALPLLQETMGQLWLEMEQRVLSYHAYETLSNTGVGRANGCFSSGLAVVFVMKADNTLAQLNSAQQLIARRIFLRLIQFGEGRADTRRQQPLSALRSVGDDPDEFDRTLEHLTNHRLLTCSGGDGGEDSWVDIAHESIITTWSRMQEWLEQRRESEQLRRRLENKTQEWLRFGHGNGGLLDAVELPEAERWLASVDAEELGYDTTLVELIDASRHAIDEDMQTRELARQQELVQAAALAAEHRQRIVEQNHANKRLQRLLAGLVLVFLIAIVTAVFAWVQRQKAQTLAQAHAIALVETEQARLSAVAQLLLIEAQQQQAINLDERGALLARQGYLYSKHGLQGLKDQVDGVLRSVLSKPYFSTALSPLAADSVAFSPDGLLLASAHRAVGKVLLWDLTQPGSAPTLLAGFPGDKISNKNLPIYAISALAFSLDGKTLVAGNEDGTLARWDLQHPDILPVLLERLPHGIWSIAFDPQGRFLAVGSKQNNTVWLWDLSNPSSKPLPLNGAAEQTVATGPAPDLPGGTPVVFSPDGQQLAVAGLEGNITIYNSNDLDGPAKLLLGHQKAVWSLAFSLDGKILASAGVEKLIRLWDLQTPEAAVSVLKLDRGEFTTMTFSPDGQLLMAKPHGGWARLWQWQQPAVAPAVVPDSGQRSLAFSPDGKYLAVGGGSQAGLQLKNLSPSGQPVTLAGHQTLALSVAFSPAGDVLASGGGGRDKTIRLWNLNNQTASAIVMHGHESGVASVAFSPDGLRLLSTGSRDNTVRIWDLKNPDTEMLAMSVREPGGAVFSPDGNTLALSSQDGVYLWDVADLNTPIAGFQQASGWIAEIVFSADGKTLALPSWDGVIYLLDLTLTDNSGAQLRGHNSAVWSAAFSPNGRWLASGGKDTKLRLWDLYDTQAPATILGQHNEEITKVRFSPDGRYIATSSADHSVRLWDIENPGVSPAVLLSQQGSIWSLAFSRDGKRLATAGADTTDKTIRIWDLTHPLNNSSTRAVADRVCEQVLRNLTLDEWHKFVGTNIPYERTCVNLPVHPSLSEAARQLAKEGNVKAAIELFARIAELDPDLKLNLQQESERWTHLAGQSLELVLQRQ